MKISRGNKVAIALAVLALLIQLVPVDRENPPAAGELSVPPEVQEVLRASCWDCHSNETRWPWYAWIAPVSWLVAHDVEEAREHLNFSTWTSYGAEQQAALREEIWEEVEEGEMPLPIYLALHPEAGLSDEELRVLHHWAASARNEAD